jgi:hypothetical protein
MNQPTITPSDVGIPGNAQDTNTSSLDRTDEGGKAAQVKEVTINTTAVMPNDNFANGRTGQAETDQNEALAGETTRSTSDKAAFDYMRFKAGDRDPRRGVTIKEVLFMNEDSLV